MKSLQPTGWYIDTRLEAVELISHKRYSTNDSRKGGNLKATIDNTHNQGGNPTTLHVRDIAMEEFDLNICDSLFTILYLPILTYLPLPTYFFKNINFINL